MNDKELSFIDLLSIMSFVIGLKNLDENITQSDKQDLQDDLNNKTHYLLNELHGHLKEQDKKLDMILEVLNGSRVFQRPDM